MGKLKTFEILVDNRGGRVEAGDTLRGQVLLELCDDISVNEIRMNFTGRCHVQWSTTSEQSSAPMAEIQTSVIFNQQDDEVYFDKLSTLYPVRQDDLNPNDPARQCEPTTLTRGTHSYDFEFVVPETCPSSFSGPHGYVRYMLKAVVERPWKVDFNIRTIVVESGLDLNTIPEARDPVELTDEMRVYNMFFQSGHCRATLRLPRKGMMLGEVIPAEFFVHNGAHQELNKVSLILRMVVTYRAGGQKCTMEVTLAKVSLGKVPAGKTLEGRERTMRVPRNCPPSGLPGCTLICVQYKLELKIKPAVLSLKRLRLITYIIVGTTPMAVTSFLDSPPDYWSCCPPPYEDVAGTSPWSLTKTKVMSPKQQQQQQRQRASSSEELYSPSDFPYTYPAWNEGDGHPHVLPPSINDEPRLTVLRQPSSPLTEDPHGALGERDVHPLARPRANTGPVPRMARARGR